MKKEYKENEPWGAKADEILEKRVYINKRLEANICQDCGNGLTDAGGEWVIEMVCWNCVTECEREVGISSVTKLLSTILHYLLTTKVIK
jgi:hypothetical protein